MHPMDLESQAERFRNVPVEVRDGQPKPIPVRTAGDVTRTDIDYRMIWNVHPRAAHFDEARP